MHYLSLVKYEVHNTMNTDSFPLNLQRLSLEGQREERTEGRDPKTKYILLEGLEKQLLVKKEKHAFLQSS